ncbi:hypothetical protein [Ilumatobacter nonamiensis]|nr:hypothetical protein [Ilumatobacter nonamiensis]
MKKHDSLDPLTMLGAAPFTGVGVAMRGCADTMAIPAAPSAQR